MEKKQKRAGTGAFRVILAGFSLLILLGAVLLCLPISSKDRVFTPFPDSLFTAVSATCVTGLIVRDTATYWSLFGQCVILTLIQIGGMGVITVGLAILKASGEKISLRQRSLMQTSISAPAVGGILNLTGFILKMTLILELAGAAALCPVFCRDFGAKGIWYAVFHAVSAFCNAGFDLMGVREPFSSLTTYQGDILLNVVVMFLIVAGGIGFLTWEDFKENRLRFRKYKLQSKIILITTALLLILPAVYNFIFEYSGLPMKERVLSSLFQSVTMRTAGFNTADLNATSEGGKALMILLMLTGGSPGSTAGGMKTTTLAVLFLTAWTVFRRKNEVQCLNRRVGEDAVRTAGAIVFTYLALFLLAGIIISRVEALPLGDCLFETASAVGTVGVTLGITTTLSLPSKLILMLLMFFGRVGALTLIYAAVPTDTGAPKLPLEKIAVG